MVVPVLLNLLRYLLMLLRVFGDSLPTCTHRCASCMHSTEGLKGQRQRPSIGVCAVSGAARGFRHGGQAQGFLKRFQVLRDPQHCLQGVCQHRSESIAQWSAASSWHLSCGSSPPCLGGGAAENVDYNFHSPTRVCIQAIHTAWGSCRERPLITPCKETSTLDILPVGPRLVP